MVRVGVLVLLSLLVELKQKQLKCPSGLFLFLCELLAAPPEQDDLCLMFHSSIFSSKRSVISSGGVFVGKLVAHQEEIEYLVKWRWEFHEKKISVSGLLDCVVCSFGCHVNKQKNTLNKAQNH